MKITVKPYGGWRNKFVASTDVPVKNWYVERLHHIHRVYALYFVTVTAYGRTEADAVRKCRIAACEVADEDRTYSADAERARAATRTYDVEDC